MISMNDLDAFSSLAPAGCGGYPDDSPLFFQQDGELEWHPRRLAPERLI
jgi:hypothetical protein